MDRKSLFARCERKAVSGLRRGGRTCGENRTALGTMGLAQPWRGLALDRGPGAPAPLRGTGDWPPTVSFDNVAWEIVQTDTIVENSITLRLELGAPVHVRVERSFFIGPTRAAGTLHVRQTMERTAPSALPVCLWQLAQLPMNDPVRMGIPEDTPFAGGLRGCRRAQRPVAVAGLSPAERVWMARCRSNKASTRKPLPVMLS